MFSITDAAGAHLAESLERADAPEDVFARLEQEEGGLVLRRAQALPGDSTFAYEGKTVFVLSDELCQQLGDSTLDVEDTDEGPRLRLK